MVMILIVSMLQVLLASTAPESDGEAYLRAYPRIPSSSSAASGEESKAMGGRESSGYACPRVLYVVLGLATW